MQKQIDRVLADNGIAVCVFDADVTRTRPAEKIKYDDMRRKYAKNPSVILCDSMPSIEFWFLLHYLNTNRYFATSDDVIIWATKRSVQSGMGRLTVKAF